MTEAQIIEDWFLFLPEGYNERAKIRHEEYIVACRSGGDDVRNRKVRNMYDAINYGICWGDTPEGHGFWEKIHTILAKDGDMSKFPPLPPFQPKEPAPQPAPKKEEVTYTSPSSTYKDSTTIYTYKL